MSEAAVAQKAAKSPAAPAAANAKAAQPLREVQVKKFGPSALKSLGYGDREIMTLTAPAGMTFAEVMAPIAWNNVANIVARDALNTRNLKDGVGSLIILDTEDSSYLAHLRIRKVVRDKVNNPCGLELDCIGPSIDPKTGEARPIDLKTKKAWVDPAPAPAKED
jgi:hypothetical protein